jgi:hypothetical protein
MRNSSFLQRFKIHSSFAAVLAALSMPVLNVPQSYAFGGGSGNPFGNGSFFPNTGTFQATIRGTNVSGLAVFSTSSDGAGGGSFTIYNGASTYIGNVNSSISGSTLSVTMEASLPGTGQGTSSAVVASTFGLVSREVIQGGTASTTTETVTPDQTTTIAGGTTSTTTSDSSSVTTPDQVTTIAGGTTTETTTTPNQNTTVTTSSSGDILLFQFDPVPGGDGTAPEPGGVILIDGGVLPSGGDPGRPGQVVSVNAGAAPVQSPINPALPGIGNESTTTTTIDGGTTTTETTTPEQQTTVSGGTTTTENSSSVETITPDQVTTITGGTASTTETTVTPDQVNETFGLINTVANSTFNDVNYAAGSFTAKLSNSYPNQVFRGSGTLTFQTVDSSGPIPQLVSVTVPIQVTGTRSSNEAGSFVPVQVDVPRVFTQLDIQVN